MKKVYTKRLVMLAIIIGMFLLAASFIGGNVSAGEDLNPGNSLADGLNETLNEVDIPMADVGNDVIADTAEPTESTPAPSTTTSSTTRPSLSDLYVEEDNLADYVGTQVDGEDLTVEEVIEVIEVIEELPMDDMGELAKLPEIVVSTVVDAVDAINNERTTAAEEDKANGIRNDIPDVGISNIPHAEETVAPETEVRGNESTTIGTTDNGVAIKVEEPETETTIATKTMVKVYGPNGYTAEYECGESVWSEIPLDGGYGQYTINVYQDVDGNGYKFVSQSRETKKAPVSYSNSYSNSYSEPDEVPTSTEVEGTYVAPDFSRLETETVEVSEPETTTAPETASVVEEEPVVVETPAAETAPEEPAEAPVVEDGMDLDDLLAGLGF